MRRSRCAGKKGNAIIDTLMVCVVLVAFVAIALIGRVILSDMNADIQASDDMGAESKAMMATMNTDFPTVMDNAALLAYVLLWVFAIVASFLIDTHPAFMIGTVILMIFLVFISGVLANTYADLAQDPEIDGEVNFPKTTFIMQHLIEYMLVVCGSVAIVLYGKSRYGT